MLKRQFKNPYFLMQEDLIEEVIFDPAARAPDPKGGPDRPYVFKRDVQNKINSIKTGPKLDEAFNIPKGSSNNNPLFRPPLSKPEKAAFNIGSAIHTAGLKMGSVTDRLISKSGALGFLGGAVAIGGGIAAYNHFTDSNISIPNASAIGGVLGGVGNAFSPEIGSAASFIGAHGSTIAAGLGGLALLAGIITHPYLSLGLATSLGSFAYVLNKKENVDECKKLSGFIEKAYRKAILLKYNELQTILTQAKQDFQQVSAKCELGTPAFNKISVNYNCSLEAYVGYCTALFVGLLTTYLKSVNAKGINLKHITRIEQVLAIREDLALNIMLNESYVKLNKAIAYIFKPFPEVISKYNVTLDNIASDLTQKLDKVQPKQQVSANAYNNSGFKANPGQNNAGHKLNDHRQFKKYAVNK
jgi:hypothetical protein